ncbi:MAG: SH3 domain-containing protein [Ktedonobacterales bacterium]
MSDRIDHWRDRPEWVWVWCTGPDGSSGWVPDAYIERTGENAIIRRDYDAAELTVQAGAEVVVEREESGWFWCVTRQGACGWIPIENVVLL